MGTIKKAIIPAAGLGTRFLPATKAQPKEMLPIVDKPTIQYIVEEAVASGIEGYEQIVVKNQQLIYARSYENQKVYVALNLEGTEAKMSFKDQSGHKYVDVLNNHKEIIFENDEYQIQLQPFSSQILVAEE